MTVRITAGVAGYVGLLTCGRVWICPVCSAKIMMKRGLEIAAGVDAWHGLGRTMVFTTTTARHHAGDQLAPLLDAVVRSWSAVTSGKSWMEDKERLGIAGFARALEVLHSARNGWHPHLHSLLYCGEDVVQADVEKFQRRVYSRWNGSLTRLGYSSLPIAQKVIMVAPGSDPSAIGRYLAKTPENLSTGRSLGYELTSSQSKGAGSIGRTQWQLAASAAGGHERDQRLWRTFELATAGRRQLTWSHGLRDQLALAQEQSDDEIAQESIGTEQDNVVYLTADGWTTVLSHPGLAVSLLRLLEQSRQQFLVALSLYGIEHVQLLQESNA